MKKSTTMKTIETVSKGVKPIVKSRSAQRISHKPMVEVKLTPSKIKPKQSTEVSPKFTEEKEFYDTFQNLPEIEN